MDASSWRRGDLDRLRAQKTGVLTTFRRNGTPVATPVTIAVVGDRVFFRTYDKAGKAKRLRRNAEVEVAPSTFRGQPRGDAVPALAVLLSGSDEQEARRAIGRRSPVLQGLLVPLAHKLARYRTMHFELLPRPAATTRSAA